MRHISAGLYIQGSCYTMNIIGLPYVTEYMHLWVVCLRLEGNLVN